MVKAKIRKSTKAPKVSKEPKVAKSPKVIKVSKVEAAKPSQEPKAVKKTKASQEMNDAQTAENKQEIIDSFAQKKGDTGSPEVQVALLTFKTQRLSSHLEENKKDNHSRRGLLKIIAKRRRILNYLQKLDEARYKELIKKLGLKK